MLITDASIGINKPLNRFRFGITGLPSIVYFTNQRSPHLKHTKQCNAQLGWSLLAWRCLFDPKQNWFDLLFFILKIYVQLMEVITSCTIWWLKPNKSWNYNCQQKSIVFLFFFCQLAFPHWSSRLANKHQLSMYWLNKTDLIDLLFSDVIILSVPNLLRWYLRVLQQVNIEMLIS